MSTQTYVNNVTLSDATEWNRWDTAAYCYLTGVAGTNTITATGPANMTLAAPQHPVVLVPAATNTGATTLNITPSGGAALTAKNVFANGVACVGGELVIGVPAILVYDGTQYNIMNPQPVVGTQATTFTWDGSGGTSGSITLTFKKLGKFVDMSVPTALATSGTGSTILQSDTAFPAAFRPVANQFQPCNIIQNNGAAIDAAGQIVILTTGIIQIRRDGALTAFTNTTACGTAAGSSVRFFIA